MPPKEFVFVNKNAKSKSLTRADGAERSLVFSHVRQGWSSTKRLPSSSTFALPEPSGQQETGPFGPTYTCVGRPKGTEAMQEVFKNALALHRAGGDPFNICASLTINRNLPLFNHGDKRVNPYIDFLLSFYGSSFETQIFPLEVMANASKCVSLAFAAEDPVAMYALSSNAAGALFAQNNREEHYLSSAYFKGRAMQLLRKELGNIQRQDAKACRLSTVYAIALLLWIECLQGDFQAVEAHLAGLERVVTLAGGMASFPLPIMATVLDCSYLCCAMTRRRPVLQPAPVSEQMSRDTIPAIERIVDTVDSSMASGFFSAANAAILGPDLLTIIEQKRRCLLLRQHLASKQYQPTHDEIQTFYSLEMSVSHRLLSYRFEHDADSDTLATIRDGLCHIVYAFAQPIMSISLSTTAFSRSVAQICKTTVERAHDAGDDDDDAGCFDRSRDLLLWVLLVAAHVLRASPDWPWLIAEVASIVEQLEIESPWQLEGILVGFFWFPEHLHGTLDAVWAGVQPFLSGGPAQLEVAEET